MRPGDVPDGCKPVYPLLEYDTMELSRVTRVSRLKHVTKRVFTFIGADTLVVLIGDNWIPVRGDGRRKWINADGTIRNITADDFATLEAMVECKTCLEHGTGACQGTLCGG